MVGSFLRTSQSTTLAPTGYGGPNPYDDQRRIDSYTSTTSIGVFPAMDYAHSGCKYLISDPIDVAPHMINALLRGAEYHLALARGRNEDRAERAYQTALLKAREADSIIKQPRVAGDVEVGYENYTVTLD
jgi:hypothetical protein